jgi:hypothetical protein
VAGAEVLLGNETALADGNSWTPRAQGIGTARFDAVSDPMNL